MKIIRSILFSGISFVIMLVVLDVFIQQAGIENTSLTNYEYERGKVRPAGKSYILFNEGFSIGSFNEGNYLSKYYPPRDSSDDNTIRLVLLGDSYVEAFQVLEREHFGTLLQHGLQCNLKNKTVEVLNFGYSGFDIGDMYAYSQTLASDYAPDKYVFMISEADLIPRYKIQMSPRTVLKDGELALERKYSKVDVIAFNTDKALLRYSSIGNMLNKARKTTREQLLVKCFDKFYSPSIGEELEDVEVENHFQIDSISYMIIDEYQDKLIVVNRSDNSLPSEFVSYLDSVQVPYIDLSVVMQKMYDSGVDPHFWEVTSKRGHWNKEAHKEIANEMIRALSSLLP